MNNVTKITYIIILTAIGTPLSTLCMNIFNAVINDDIATINILATIAEPQRIQSLNQTDTLGNTPLHYAALFGNTETIKALVTVGARLDIQNNNGRRPAELTVDPENTHMLDRYQRRIEEAPQQALTLSRIQAFTVAQAFQGRLGSSSPAATLTPFLLQDIMKLVKPANEQACALQARLDDNL
jgi:ankyrin repeat protein